ncbi:hypothetical protein Aperf_G00000113996 [Anoplocephala perfoliata]
MPFSRFSFECDSSSLKNSILSFGKIHRQDDACLVPPLSSNSNMTSWLQGNKNSVNPFEELRNSIRLQSISSDKTDTASFEILDCTPATSSRSCSLSADAKIEAITKEADQESLFPLINSKTWVSEDRPRIMDLGITSGLFPDITKNSDFWVRNASISGQFNKSPDKDIETKMKALMIKQENDKPTKDIESDVPKAIGSTCKSVDGDPVCKFFSSCTFQGLNNTKKISSKPCVQAWLNSQSLAIGKSSSEESEDVGCRRLEASTVISDFRQIGATDSAMWLAGKRPNAMASGQSDEGNQVPSNQMRGDNLCETWLHDRSVQAGTPPPSREVGFHIAKRSKLANFLLDSQQNLEADLEAILYRSPFAVRATANWLQPTNNNRKANTAA